MDTRLLVAVILAEANAVGGAFVNLDFEQGMGDPNRWDFIFPGWSHISGIGTPVDGVANLSEWAEAVLTTSGMGYGPGVLEGSHSIAFFCSYARWVTSGDQYSGWVDMGYTGEEEIGRAYISQTGTVEGGGEWLTFLTSYTGPRQPDPGVDFLRDDVGEMVIQFDGAPVGFALAETQRDGRSLNRVWADLRPFIGVTGDLRIGVEGPQTFVIDSLRLVPEGRNELGVIGLAAVGGLAWFFRRGRTQSAMAP